MTNADDLSVIRNHFLTTWDAGVPVVLDNVKAIDKPKAMWARFSVMPGAERRRSIASRTYEQLGRVYLQIFIPTGTYDEGGWKLAETFAASFRDWKSADYRIRFDTPEFSTSDAEKETFLILVSIPYTAQH